MYKQALDMAYIMSQVYMHSFIYIRTEHIFNYITVYKVQIYNSNNITTLTLNEHFQNLHKNNVICMESLNKVSCKTLEELMISIKAINNMQYIEIPYSTEVYHYISM